MSSIDEAKRLRVRDAALADDLLRLQTPPAEGAPCLVANTTTLGSYPSAPSSFFACNPLTVLGTEVEGGTGIITTDSATFFAYNLGSAVPPQGTAVLVTFVGNRWVFRYDG
jgi:hypothetical protein